MSVEYKKIRRDFISVLRDIPTLLLAFVIVVPTVFLAVLALVAGSCSLVVIDYPVKRYTDWEFTPGFVLVVMAWYIMTGRFLEEVLEP